jgi:hypothetical protein
MISSFAPVVSLGALIVASTGDWDAEPARVQSVIFEADWFGTNQARIVGSLAFFELR